MVASRNSALGLTSFDVVMPCSSLYHGTAWGIPFSAPICGAKLVLPADKMDGKDLHELIEAEGVTFSCGVPTIWTMYLANDERTADAQTTHKLLQIGSSALTGTRAHTHKTPKQK